MRLTLAVLLLVGCHADAVHDKYKKPYEVEKFTGYQVSGLELWHVTGQSVPDRNGPSFIVGVDRDGKLVEGGALFQRAAPGLSPDDLGRRAFDTLLARAGGGPLDPAKDTPLDMFPKEEWALVQPASVEAGVLTFWYVEGEMHPEVTRGRLTLATGELERRRASDVLHPQ